MHHLATDIWTKHPETRIDWCRKTCKQFFFQEDGLTKQLKKDEKRKYYADLAENCTNQNSDGSGGALVGYNADDKTASCTDCIRVCETGTSSETVSLNYEILGKIPSDESVEYSPSTHGITSTILQSSGTNSDIEEKLEITDSNLEAQRQTVYAKYQPRSYNTM